MTILLLAISFAALVVVASYFVTAAHDLNLSEALVVVLFVTVAVVVTPLFVVEGTTKQQDGSYLVSGKRDLVEMFPEYLPTFMQAMGVVEGMDPATKRCLWQGLTGRNHTLLNLVLETELEYYSAQQVIDLCLMAD